MAAVAWGLPQGEGRMKREGDRAGPLLSECGSQSSPLYVSALAAEPPGLQTLPQKLCNFLGPAQPG